MTTFRLTVEQAGDDTIVLTIRGEVDVITATEFDRHLHIALGSGASTVIVDLSHCEFFDSSALNVLAHAGHRHDGSPTLSLVVPSECVARRAFELTQFDRMFPVYPGRETAVSANTIQ